MSSSMGECHRRDAVLILGVICLSAFDSSTEEKETHRVDKLYARQVHVVFGVFIQDLWIVYGLGAQILVA